MIHILLAFTAAALPAAAPLAPSAALRASSSVPFAPTAALSVRSDAALAIRARWVWTGTKVLENAVVVVQSGRIQAVGADVEIPDGAEVLEHQGVLTAGMIALHGTAGAVGETRDATRPALPEARMGIPIDGRSVDFAPLWNAGITSLLVTPDSSGITSGTSALVRTADGGVLRDPAHLSLVFSNEGLSGNREPTSRSGALALLNELFENSSGVVADAKSGKLTCLFEVRERDDVLRAIAFAKGKKLSGALHGAWLSGELSEPIRDSGLFVIVPALGVGTPKRTLDAVARLEKDGVVFGFGLDAPWNHPDLLRLSAALCVRAGLESQAAWRGLTANAAKISGVEARMGRIERGFEADLVLWSGDPLDLATRSEIVISAGKAANVERADHASAKESK